MSQMYVLYLFFDSYIYLSLLIKLDCRDDAGLGYLVMNKNKLNRELTKLPTGSQKRAY